MPLLEIRTKQSQRRLELSGKPVSIGRSPENTLVLTDSRASREHCLIELVDDRWSVRDLKSRNGTQLNDESITRPERLANGDVILIGRAEIRFIDPEAARVA